MLPLALQIHHHFHGPPVGYVGIFAAAVLGWAGLPGSGEVVLITAGVFAQKGRLDIASVIVAAWAGAVAGGTLGWVVAMRGGRPLLARIGLLRGPRGEATVERGRRIFARFGVLAVLLTPSWVAGLVEYPPRKYLPTNALAAFTWAVGIGLAAYFAGPAVDDVVDGIGTASTIVLGAVIVVPVVLAVASRWRRTKTPDFQGDRR